MTYYRTIEEDLQRAKEILAKGKQHRSELLEDLEASGVDASLSAQVLEVGSGATIYGADIYAAYKLIESFVGQIEKDRFYYRDLEEHMRRVVKEVKGAPSMLLYDQKPYKVIPEDLADAIEKLV